MSCLSPCKPLRAPYARDPVDEEVEAYLLECQSSSPTPVEVRAILASDSDRYYRMYGLNPNNTHKLASSLLEIMSITIHPTSEKERCNVYGNISLIDEKHNTVGLYNRSVDEPEMVGEIGYLTLGNVSVVAAQPYRVSVSLWDKDNNEKIVEVSSMINQEDFDENIKVKNVYGNNDEHISITYRTLSAGVVAEVSVYIEKQNSYGSSYIYGAIRTIRNPDFEDKKNVITLFRKEKNEAICVDDHDGDIELVKSMVAVRGCSSSLRLGVIIYEIDTECAVVRGSVGFEVCSEHVNRLVIWGEERKWKVVVYIDWSYHYKLLYEMNKTVYDICTRLYTGIELGLVEVFSVSIGCNGCVSGEEMTGVYGKIRVRDCSGEFLVYDGNGEDTFTTFWPYKCVKSSEFRMRLSLEDVEGNEVCRGHLGLDWPNLDFERIGARLCSVISGEKMCATIHYSVFTDALQCKIVIEFFSAAKSKLMNVFGKIVARYDKHEYKSSYDKKYYQSLLFQSSCENPAIVQSSGCYLPLVKRAVVVPNDCSIIISADLSAFSRTTKVKKHSSRRVETETKKTSSMFVLNDEVKFKRGRKDSKVIDGDGFYLVVSVRWEK